MSTKKTIHKPKKSPASGRKRQSATELNNHFDQMIETASAWCAEHQVLLAVSPPDALRLWNQRDQIHAAVMAAGGQTKVPEAVLLYEQTIDDAASFMLAHGVGRALQLVLSGKGL